LLLPPHCSYGKILYRKISSGKIYTARRYFPVDGGISDKIGGGEKSNNPFFMESGFLLIKLKCIRIG
jgi:hypothetical protein